MNEADTEGPMGFGLGTGENAVEISDRQGRRVYLRVDDALMIARQILVRYRPPFDTPVNVELPPPG